MSFALIRSKGPIRGDGHIIDVKSLRKAIPAAHILNALVEIALSGRLSQIDLATGEEVGPARPVSVELQQKTLLDLLNKRLPTTRAEDIEEGPKADLDKITLSPEEIKRMPLSELGRVIEATYEKVPTTNDPTPDP